MSSFAFALILATTSLVHAAAKTDPALDATPAGLVPSTAHVAAILAKHDASVGNAAKSFVEDWSFTDTGKTGTEHLVQSGTDYHSTIATAVGTEQFGQLDGKRWHRDLTGYTTPSSNTDESSFQAIRITEDASDPKNDVSLAGQTTGENPAYVLKVAVSQEHHPEWLFFDAQTSRVVRIERVQGTHRLITTFDDFRTVDGITQPWHMHDSYWTSELDDDWKITSFHGGVPIKPGEFTAPANPITPGVAVRTKLPSTFTYATVILRMTVNGRGLDFELDPSVRYSYIDYSVAQSLDLPTYGQTTRLRNGDQIPYDTRIADADIGPIHLHDFPVYATNVSWKPRDDVRVVGTLGYDFLAANVIHVDWVHDLAEVFPTSMMPPEPALPIAGALDIPMQYDDGSAMVPMALGDGFTEHVMFDPAEPWTMVFGGYLNAHQSSFVSDDRKRNHDFVPFADGASYGKVVDTWLTQTSTAAFANLNYQNLAMIATDYTYGSRDIDAIIGFDYLRYYDTYYDYPHDRLLLVPNAWFFKLAKPNAH